MTGVVAIDGPQPTRKGMAAKAIRDIATFVEFFIVLTSAREDAAKLSFGFQPILMLPSLMAAALEKEFVSALADLCLGRLRSSSLPESTHAFYSVVHLISHLLFDSDPPGDFVVDYLHIGDAVGDEYGVFHLIP